MPVRRRKPRNDPPELAKVTQKLSKVMTAGAASAWLQNPNPLLDNRCPADLIAAGRHRDVLDLVDAMADGIFV